MMYKCVGKQLINKGIAGNKTICYAILNYITDENYMMGLFRQSDTQSRRKIISIETSCDKMEIGTGISRVDSHDFTYSNDSYTYHDTYDKIIPDVERCLIRK